MDVQNDVKVYIEELCKKVKSAAPKLAGASTVKKNAVLSSLAEKLVENSGEIIAANDIDVAAAAKDPALAKMADRLKLDEGRIKKIADSLGELVKLKDPVGSGDKWVLPNGLEISRVRAPLGVAAMIYEARPNVTVDAAALCIKTGNAVILRGGKDAYNTNLVLEKLIKEALTENGISGDVCELVKSTSRESTAALMEMRGYIDVLIPRGGKGLIKAVVENAKVPVIETGAGNCHLYVDSEADIEKALTVSVSAKISRPSVCNALESLLVHSAVAESFLPEFEKRAAEKGVEIRGCERSLKLLKNAKPATDEDYYTEYNDLIISVKTVDSLDEAIEHINSHSTHHSETIMTENIANAARFKNEIDSAAVYVNASTRFTDGGEFGFGAEIGISTQKLHARGPMGLTELTTVKYLIDGNGQIR